METKTEYAVMTEPTLAELKTIEQEWLRQGAGLFTDLVMTATTLGEAHSFWCRGNDIARVFNTAGITMLYTNMITTYNPGARAFIHKESLLVTVGDWTYAERTVSGEPIIRETVVCKLQRYGCAGTWSPVEIDNTLAIFVPGKWTKELLSHLSYAHEIFNSRREMSEEFERLALAKKLLIGREI